MQSTGNRIRQPTLYCCRTTTTVYVLLYKHSRTPRKLIFCYFVSVASPPWTFLVRTVLYCCTVLYCTNLSVVAACDHGTCIYLSIIEGEKHQYNIWVYVLNGYNSTVVSITINSSNTSRKTRVSSDDPGTEANPGNTKKTCVRVPGQWCILHFAFLFLPMDRIPMCERTRGLFLIEHISVVMDDWMAYQSRDIGLLSRWYIHDHTISPYDKILQRARYFVQNNNLRNRKVDAAGKERSDRNQKRNKI